MQLISTWKESTKCGWGCCEASRLHITPFRSTLTCSYLCSLFFPQQGARSPSGRDVHPLGDNTAGSTFSRLQSVGPIGARGSDCPEALCCVLTLLAAPIGVRVLSGFQQHKEFLPPVCEYPRKGGRGWGNSTLGSQILQLFSSQSRET